MYKHCKIKIFFDKDVKLEVISSTPDDPDIASFLECDSKNPDKVKEKT